jgi:hypothetical protein
MKDKINIILFIFMVLLTLSLISLFECSKSNNNPIGDSSSDLFISDTFSDSLEDSINTDRRNKKEIIRIYLSTTLYR